MKIEKIFLFHKSIPFFKAEFNGGIFLKI